MVWEKKKYFLWGINASMGTSFTPSSTSQVSISVTTWMPFSVYSLSENTRIGDDSTKILAFGYLERTFWHSSGDSTTLRSGGFLRSLMIPSFIYDFGIIVDQNKSNRQGKQTFYCLMDISYLCRPR